MLARWQDAAAQEKVWLRFAEGHPVSGLTVSFLEWCCEQTQALGKRVSALIVCPWPTKSPWRYPLEPMWMHGKHRVVEPERVLPAPELAPRVCQAFGCAHEDHLTIPENVP